MTSALKIFLLLFLAAAAGGCLAQSHPDVKTTYYALEYSPPQPRSAKRLPFILSIERFTVAPVLQTERIVYRGAPFKRDAYHYHRWRASPADMASFYLGRDFAAGNVLEAVSGTSARLTPSHVIEGTVEEFMERDDPDGWKAVLTLNITLLRAAEPDVSRRVLFQRRYRWIEACAQNNPEALAAAMSRAMARVSAQVMEDTCKALRAELSGGGASGP